MIHVFLCGPSGGGKTTLAKEFALRHGYAHIESITRLAYKLYGMANQAAANELSPPEHLDLQRYVSQVFLEQATHLMASTKVPLIFERSPMDYAAYLFNAEHAVDATRDEEVMLLPIVPDGHKVATVYVPSPPPEWSLSDTFRSIPANELRIQQTMRTLYDSSEGLGTTLTTTDLQARVDAIASLIGL